MQQPKFKYLLSPENTYIIDFGEYISEITGAEIMNALKNVLGPVQPDDSHTSRWFPPKFDEDTPDAGL